MDIPFTNFKKWRMKKRRELDDAIKSLDRLGNGRFYTPDCGNIYKAQEELQKLKALMSDSNWTGR